MNRRDSLKLLLAASSGSVLSPLFAEGQAVIASAASANGAEESSLSSSQEHKGAIAPAFTWLTLGEVKPAGWIKEQMVRDLDHGFAGRLDELCQEASSDIFVSHRNTGVVENTVNSAKINWWNGETEGNWRAGHIMMAYLTEDKQAMTKADAYVRHILSSQDADGYLGVFAPDLRYTKPGDLWTQTCLMRGLLDYVEFTGDRRVHEAVVRATDLTMARCSGGKMILQEGVGGDGASHDYMFSDVMERLFDLTGDAKYRDFALELYQNLNQTVKDADTSLPSLLNREAGFRNHGANTYETIRLPLWLWMATGREDFGRASRNALDKLSRYTEVSGSGVSQESISNLSPDPSFTEYEYCATKEIQFTLESALQKTGVAALADKIEWLWFNAAQGSRLPDGSAITYLTTDNRLHCDGISPDGKRPDRSNTFSPTHSTEAVCCNPNAANVAALFVRGMWMRSNGGGLAALLSGPSKVSTKINGVRVHIEEKTSYPFDNTVEIELHPERATEFPLILRDPAWSGGTTVTCAGANIRREGSYWIVSKKWTAGDAVTLKFAPSVREVPAVNGEIALQYGALLFVQPIEAQKTVIRTYTVPGFEDTSYLPVPGKYQALALPASSRWKAFGFEPVHGASSADALRPFDEPVVLLKGTLVQQSGGAEVATALVPIGNAPTLRRVTFPIA
ncbi:MAG: beta-L-arabinofuranosidase domain-containing protein [Terracidiphilus sp.]|jgi:DUF1680 family protein